MLHLHVTIYTVDETFSANKDFKWALVEKTIKHIDFRIFVLPFPWLLWFQYLSLWMLKISYHSKVNVSKQYCVFSRTSPQTPKNMWKQLWQNLALYCMYLKWNPEFPIGRCWKQKKRQTEYFGFHPFYLEFIKGWWGIRWKSNSEKEN